MLLFLGQLMEFNQHNIIAGKPSKANHHIAGNHWKADLFNLFNLLNLFNLRELADIKTE